MYSVSAAVTLDYNRAGGCCLGKRENERKDRNIVDRKSEKSVVLVHVFHSSVLTPNGGGSGGTRTYEVCTSKDKGPH